MIVEALIAALILSYSLLSAGQLILTAMSASSLARAQSHAAVIAQDKLESLADRYRFDSGDPDLAPGTHGGEQVRLRNLQGILLNSYAVSWNVSAIADPRGSTTCARLVQVTVVPASADGVENIKALLNKTVQVSTIVGCGVQ